MLPLTLTCKLATMAGRQRRAMTSSSPAAVISASKAGPSQVLLPTTTRSLGGERQEGLISYFNVLLPYSFLVFFPLAWSKEHGLFSCWYICKTKEGVFLQPRYLVSNSGFCIIVGKVACHLTGGTHWCEGQPGAVSSSV